MKIVHYPHPALRHQSKPVTCIDKQLQLHIGGMKEVMYDGQGARPGRAAGGAAVSASGHEHHRRPEPAGARGGLPQPADRRTQGLHGGRGGLPELPRALSENPPVEDDQGAGLQPQGRAGREGRQRPGVACLAARDRPPQRRVVHRHDGPDRPPGEPRRGEELREAISAACRNAARSRRTWRSRSCWRCSTGSTRKQRPSPRASLRALGVYRLGVHPQGSKTRPGAWRN